MNIKPDSSVLHHYRVEKELAARLMSASKDERRLLYTKLYDELFARVPQHAMLGDNEVTERRHKSVDEYCGLIGRYVNDNSVFLEVGPGDCALSFEVAKHVRQVVAVDVSHELTRTKEKPSNFSLIISNGTNIPMPDGSVNFAFSNQLMEHLHPEDAMEQLNSIVRSLVVGGAYMCVTPNKLSGPHDVSRHFDQVATGFHLREYTTSELVALFQEAGLDRVQALVRVKGRYFQMPQLIFSAMEGLAQMLPHRARRKMATTQPLRVILNTVCVIGFKGRIVPTGQ